MAYANADFSFGRNGHGTFVEWQTDFRLGDDEIQRGLSSAVPHVGADLIDIAVAAYVTDRLRRRRPLHAAHDGSHWRRRLHIEVAVREFATWTEPDVHRRLVLLLNDLTDDDWTIDFLPGGPRLPRHSHSQATLFEEPLATPSQVALLSGGLDSLLGAAADSHGDGELLLVSTATFPKLRRLQRDIVTGLEKVSSRRIRHLSVPVNLTAAGRALVAGADEQTQRTRAFVFLSLGAAAALAGKVPGLTVYENGPGALNLAQTPAQRGAMTTRAMRPETLRAMSDLVSAAAGHPFAVTNPNRWVTKAEMCAEASSRIDQLIRMSRSCDTALVGRRSNDAPCGRCTSCVLRRQALICAGRRDLDATDVAMMSGDSLRARGTGHVDPALGSMLAQVHAMSRALAAHDPWSALVHQWPDLAGARRALESDPAPIIDLLGRYVAEWRGMGVEVVDRMLAA